MRKALHYLRPSYHYWRRTPDWSPPRAGVIGAYPLDFQDRVTEGHYHSLDEDGLPYLSHGDGNRVYLVTRMCGYALAAWQRRLAFPADRADDEGRILLQTAARLLAQAEPLPRGGHVVHTRQSDGKIQGVPSAMNQGEAISVWLRAHALDGDGRWLQAARAALAPFHLDLACGGVRGRQTRHAVPWYEEYAEEPQRHVLNGMIYSLIGLAELAAYAGDAEAATLFDEGCAAVESALPSYHAGVWSFYRVPEDRHGWYLASMMYHNLHICQLLILNDLSGRGAFAAWAERWERQQASIPRRLAAAAWISLHKLQGRHL